TYPQMRSILRSIFPWSFLNRYQQPNALYQVRCHANVDRPVSLTGQQIPPNPSCRHLASIAAPVVIPAQAGIPFLMLLFLHR
ncbi:MAG: hypothetical protein ABTQ25_01040, partial [Nitrosomonas ureae]